MSNMNGEVDWAALYVQRKRQLDRVGTIRLSPQDVLPDLLEISDDGLSVRCTGPSVGEPFGISFPASSPHHLYALLTL